MELRDEDLDRIDLVLRCPDNILAAGGSPDDAREIARWLLGHLRATRARLVAADAVAEAGTRYLKADVAWHAGLASGSVSVAAVSGPRSDAQDALVAAVAAYTAVLGHEVDRG